MSKQIEAMKLAREWIGDQHNRTVSAGKMVAMLTEAIAEAEQLAQQEPDYRCRPYSSVPGEKVSKPVDYYKAPLEKRTWVGLTENEAEVIAVGLMTISGEIDSWIEYWHAIEAKLKEKNT